MIKKLIDKYIQYRERKYWEKRHFAFVKLMVREDARWLSIDPIAREITERYEKAIRDDWYKLDHEDVAQFRTRVNKEKYD